MENDGKPLLLDLADGKDADQSHHHQTGPIIWNYNKVLYVQSKKGGAKNFTLHAPFAIQIAQDADFMQFNSGTST